MQIGTTDCWAQVSHQEVRNKSLEEVDSIS